VQQACAKAQIFRRDALYDFFTTLNFGLGALAVAVGGSMFFRSAWRPCEGGILHLAQLALAGRALTTPAHSTPTCCAGHGKLAGR
jgi:hypothetical protein